MRLMPSRAARRASVPGSARPARQPRTRCARSTPRRGRRPAAAARVVDQELGDFAERPVLAVVHDDADAGLSGRDAHVDAVHQIRPAGADVRTEHVRAVALVVHAACDLAGRIAERCDVTEQVRSGRRSAGGTPRSRRVTSSGNMPPVCSNRWRRRSVLGRAAARATPGSHHTGSIATLVQVASPVAVPPHRPSTSSSSSRIACWSSGTVRRALVTAMVGRISQPSASCLSASPTTCP